MDQISFFDGQHPLKITKPIRLIELFAGIGAQAKALENLGVPFEHYRICEFDKYAVKSYNAVHGTEFETSDITKIHADSVCVCDTDSYTYIMTYSFPCTDLSTAGKQMGMSRGSGTRSGLLWEVERLLTEMDELPQVLLMENVPEVIGDKNIRDFAEWIAFLDKLGYKSKYQILNATDYGVPQNRERCFMVSWLGDYYYNFPHPFPLDLRLRDVLEESVDEKYYLSDQRVSSLLKALEADHGHTFHDEDSAVSKTITTGVMKCGNYEQYIVDKAPPKIIVAGSLDPDKDVQDRVRVLDDCGICQGLRATDYKDPPKIMAGGIYTQESVRFNRGPLKDLSRSLKAQKHDAGVVEYTNLYPHVKGYNRMNGVVCDVNGVSQTLRANSGGHNEVKIAAIRGRNPDNPSDRTTGAHTEQRLEIGGEVSNTLTTVQKDNVVVEQHVRVRKLTPKECWRLMGFDDDSFERAERVNSNSQLYKQAGNSIVVDVLMAIFGEMLP